eukprot:TRINITY_DN4920_c0_g1_i2.p1 TRINITY_DN4920_c0_g1~~TRINITY_DN4920_c0_g1_i2.p1  ORF type:complete len:1001 (-),score=480.92 TRINITY_DN4920_c0_g1_i2:555-3383(-)
MERDGLIVEFTGRYEIVGFEDAPFNSQQAEQVVNLANEKMIKLKEQLTALKATFKSKSDKYGKTLESFQVEIRGLSNGNEQIKRQVENNKRTVEQTSEEMKKKKQYSQTLDAVEKKKEDEEQGLKVAQGQAAELEKRITESMKQKTKLDKQMAEASAVIQQLLLQTEARSAIGHKKNELKKKKDEMTKILAKIEPQVKKHLKQMPEVSKLKSQLEKEISAKSKQLSELDRKWQDQKNQHSQAKGKFELHEAQVKSLKSDLADKRKKLSVVGNRSLPDLIKEAEENIGKRNKDTIMTESASRMYGKYLELTKQHDECPLCERSFQSKEKKSFMLKLEEMLNEVPEALRKNKETLKEQQMMLEQLNALHPDYVAQLRIENEDLPAAQKSIDQIKSDIERLQIIAETTGNEVEEIKKSIEDLNGLLPMCSSLIYLENDSAGLTKEIQVEESKLKAVSSDVRSLDDLNEELAKFQKDSEEAGESIERDRKKSMEIQRKLDEKKKTIDKLKDELFNMKGIGGELKKLSEKKSELENANVALLAEFEENSEKIQRKTLEMAEVQAKKTKTDKEGMRQEEEISSEKDNFQKMFNQLTNQCRQAEKENPDEIRRKIGKIEQDQKSAEAKISEISAEIEKANKKLSESRDQSAQRDLEKSNLQNNIKHRAQLRRIEDTDKKIVELEAKYAKSASSLQEIEKQLSKVEKEYSTLKSEKDQKIGAKATRMATIKERQRQLRSKPEYATADQDHQEMIIHLKTTEMAEADLDKYYHALDKALMKYHTVKMEEINKIIKEIWENTYRGNDIETLEIRCDADTSAKARSYHYSLVMIKNGTALDMRGRCSAGQKVLASLVIRLALAETFCLNCGILALDEPTTNLDRHNVESFANALVNILETRSQQTNFQLIIITHDEEFVQLIGKSKHADYYWRVSKDAHQHSTIERQDIQDLS